MEIPQLVQLYGSVVAAYAKQSLRELGSLDGHTTEDPVQLALQVDCSLTLTAMLCSNTVRIEAQPLHDLCGIWHLAQSSSPSRAAAHRLDTLVLDFICSRYGPRDLSNHPVVPALFIERRRVAAGGISAVMGDELYRHCGVRAGEVSRVHATGTNDRAGERTMKSRWSCKRC